MSHLKNFCKRIIKRFFLRRGVAVGSHLDPYSMVEYNYWLKNCEKTCNQAPSKLIYQPLISVVIPVYNIERRLLQACLDSILNQTYQNFEICIADDHSTKKSTLKTLRRYEKKDSRVKVVYREQNGHISQATNSALALAQGEFVALVDNDDVLAKNALDEVVRALNIDPKIDMIYTDEDKIDEHGKFCDPHFKPDFSPDTLLGNNYICHLSVFRKSLLDKIGGLRDKFVGAQDYDLVLRFTEKTKHIHHIPKILYHWRKIPGSTATMVSNKNYAIENGRKAVKEALRRRGIQGKVLVPVEAPVYTIEYEVTGQPLVSIVIPTKNGADILKKCVDSIYKKTAYKNYEVLVVDNKSNDQKVLELFKRYKKQYQNFRVIKADFPFNYSKINNLAVAKARGEYVVLLNNDTEVLTRRWLDIMLGYAEQQHIGAVGVKLLYPDMTIQHVGVILGLGGIAGHFYFGNERDYIGEYGRTLVPYNYSGVTAACLMVKKQKYWAVRGMDEKLKVAYNDVDFNMKLLEKGLFNVILPHVELIHYESKTRGSDDKPERRKEFEKECAYMRRKWGNKIQQDRFYNPNLSLSRGFYLGA